MMRFDLDNRTISFSTLSVDISTLVWGFRLHCEANRTAKSGILYITRTILALLEVSKGD